jgi:5-methylcytosine-specific restriction protein B
LIVGDDVYQALDLQILQKMLPRLHGARRRLEPILSQVGKFCFDPQNGESADGAFDPLSVDPAQAKLPQSFAKIRRMTKSVRANQFASFAE